MNIYVGNLPYSFSEDDLKKLFSDFGNVSVVKIIIDRVTGTPKGFAFVEMSNAAEAQQAIAQLNGKEVGGRSIRVNEARPQERQERNFERRSNDYGSGSGSGSSRGGGFSRNRNNHY